MSHRRKDLYRTISVGKNHPNYSDPLMIIWLCPKHHKLLHLNKMELKER